MKLFKDMTQEEAKDFYLRIKTEKDKAVERNDRQTISLLNTFLDNLQYCFGLEG